MTVDAPIRESATLHARPLTAPVAAPVTVTAVTSAPIADPGPLGLAAFAGSTFVLSLFNAGLVADAKLEAVVLPLALVFGGIIQVLAGMWEFRKNNTFGAVAFTAFGAFWICFYLYVHDIAATLPPASAHTATGIFLLMWTIFTACLALAALKTNAVLASVLTTLLVTFVLLTIGAFGQNESLTHAGGYVGLLVALLGWYGCAAGVTNSTWGRTVLPVLPAKKA